MQEKDISLKINLKDKSSWTSGNAELIAAEIGVECNSLFKKVLADFILGRLPTLSDGDPIQQIFRVALEAAGKF